jgi:hypothetical protein
VSQSTAPAPVWRARWLATSIDEETVRSPVASSTIGSSPLALSGAEIVIVCATITHSRLPVLCGCLNVQSEESSASFLVSSCVAV